MVLSNPGYYSLPMTKIHVSMIWGAIPKNDYRNKF